MPLDQEGRLERMERGIEEMARRTEVHAAMTSAAMSRMALVLDEIGDAVKRLVTIQELQQNGGGRSIEQGQLVKWLAAAVVLASLGSKALELLVPLLSGR